MLNLKEWPLVVFTLLGQSAVGIFIFSFWPAIFTAAWKNREVYALAERWSLVLLGMVGLAMLISLFHLGNPLSAYLAAVNIKSSWLSREIFSLSWFFLLLLVLELLLAFKAKPAWIVITTILVGINGLLLIWVMSRIYRLTTVPVWNSFRTTASFFLTSVLMGIFGLLLAQKSGQTVLNLPGLESFARWGTAAAIFGAFLYSVLFDQAAGIFALSELNGSDSQGACRLLFFLRLIFLTLAFVLLIADLWLERTKPAYSSINYLLGLSFFLIIIEEFLGRIVFYNLYERLGV